MIKWIYAGAAGFNFYILCHFWHLFTSCLHDLFETAFTKTRMWAHGEHKRYNERKFFL